jgi:hypothetical protein
MTYEVSHKICQYDDENIVDLWLVSTNVKKNIFFYRNPLRDEKTTM